MTDRSREPGRIDLRAIDEPADARQAERVVGAALARLTGSFGEPRLDVLASINAYSRPTLAAAAVLLAIAASALVFTNRRAPAAQPDSVLATWAESQHVPTNGELLATFRGYAR